MDVSEAITRVIFHFSLITTLNKKAVKSIVSTRNPNNSNRRMYTARPTRTNTMAIIACLPGRIAFLVESVGRRQAVTIKRIERIAMSTPNQNGRNPTPGPKVALC